MRNWLSERKHWPIKRECNLRKVFFQNNSEKERKKERKKERGYRKRTKEMLIKTDKN